MLERGEVEHRRWYGSLEHVAVDVEASECSEGAEGAGDGAGEFVAGETEEGEGGDVAEGGGDRPGEVVVFEVECTEVV